MKLLRLHSWPIWEQLVLEEALFRADTNDWCLINDSTPPAIIFGLSQKPEELVHLDEAREQNIPLYRRFTGGGCVLVDEGTLFCTFIGNKEHNRDNPEGLMRWAYHRLKPTFDPLPFTLQETDFALADKKIGGNAQAFTEKRFIHHTSFLWSWDEDRIKLLKHPTKQPAWRRERPHAQFMGKLKEYFASKEELSERLLQGIPSDNTSISEALTILSRPHRKTVHLLPSTKSR